MGGTVAIFCIA